jgi:hypothetical protein
MMVSSAGYFPNWTAYRGAVITGILYKEVREDSLLELRAEMMIIDKNSLAYCTVPLPVARSSISDSTWWTFEEILMPDDSHQAGKNRH